MYVRTYVDVDVCNNVLLGVSQGVEATSGTDNDTNTPVLLVDQLCVAPA